MKSNVLLMGMITLVMLSACKKDNDETPGNEIDIPDGYSLYWHDEFESASIDMASWNYETGDGTDYGLPSGWGNNEKQIYTSDSENAEIISDENESVLAITALKDNSGGYTSARLTTKDKVSVRFGRIDVRAKLPWGQGIWPALWMLGDNIDLVDWPGCGEVDFVEVLGHDPSTLYTTLHYTNGVQKKGEVQGVYELPSGDFSDGYRVFSVDWTPDEIAFSVDGQEVYRASIGNDMKEFLRSSYLIMNVAVGGNWPGDPDASTQFPQTMYVDYVRVFTKDGFQAPEPPVLDLEEETIGQVIEPNIGDHAIKEGFTDLGSLEVISFGGGGEPLVLSSDTAIDGDKSLVFDFPGGNWGGAYIELAESKDLSGYSTLKFSLNMPESLVNAEIKLEGQGTSASIFLADYAGTPVALGFKEYTIPLSDLSGLDLTGVNIPFAIWNPQDAGQNFLAAEVLIDNLYFSD